VAHPNPTIDREINRLGGPENFKPELSDPLDFARQLAVAVSADIDTVCDQNQGCTHAVLCGGKDSLNLLLHKWKTKPIVYSAQPNLALVKQFVSDNDLGLEVRELVDCDPGKDIYRELLEGSCLVDLQHWKWTHHLKQIAKDHEGKIVFWKGQVADAFLTDYWISYTSSQNRFYKFLKKSAKQISRRTGSTAILPHRFFIHDLETSLWDRAAVAQGGHLGYLRSICDALFLSAYHGPHASSVIRRMDVARLSSRDLRPLVGQYLFGCEVIYPTENPSPPPSEFRKNLRTLDAYLNAARKFGIQT